MTVSSATNEAAFIGNDAATTFPLPFRFFANSDIIAQLIDDSTGAVYDMTLGIDYTLTGAGEPEVSGSATGQITLPAPLPSGYTLFVRRELPLTQPTDIVNQGRFFPETHETVFDRLAMQIQQAIGGLGKALRVRPTEPAPSFLPPINQRAHKLLSFDENGNPVALAPASGSAAELAIDLANSTDPAKGAGLVGYFSELGSASPSTVLGKLRERVSVLDFIPEADHAAARAGTYDCTTAIQQAIASMPATGGEIYFPHGRYLFSATININKSIVFKGTGSATVNNGNTGSVLLKAAALDGDGVRLAALGAKLVDITVQGVAGNGGDGVVLIESRCVLEDVGVFGMGRDGVRIGIDDSPSNSNLWVIRNLKSKGNARDGLRLSSKLRPTLPDANAGLLMMADLQGNGGCGLYLGNNALNTFVGLCCQANGTYGVFSSPGSYDNTFYGGDFEVNGRVGGASVTSYADFYIEAGSIANRVIGITCFNFPVSFVCNEPDNFILSANDGAFAGDNKYAGLQLRNKASSVPTVLDWYEEGVFTPVVEGITTAGVGTYSIQQGYYTRIGNVVRFHLNVAWSAHTGTGNMRIAGLPFTASDTGFQPVDIVPSAFTTPANSVVRALVAAKTGTISLYSVLTSGTTTFAALSMDTSASCWISGSYTVPG